MVGCLCLAVVCTVKWIRRIQAEEAPAARPDPVPHAMHGSNLEWLEQQLATKAGGSQQKAD